MSHNVTVYDTGGLPEHRYRARVTLDGVDHYGAGPTEWKALLELARFLVVRYDGRVDAPKGATGEKNA